MDQYFSGIQYWKMFPGTLTVSMIDSLTEYNLYISSRGGSFTWNNFNLRFKL